ncbi:hypothetical protein CGL51_08360 [Pyrobaculum aerophilum]|uniref:CRISPR system Cms protein Csm4 n=1 Tax=Pyrobaculum aerophilum TaxID=13773 RepID=A0A371QX98_9CREN|nr:hypothetical protein CGL51_08360 [Pyrobaculum aerophilum]
MRVSYVVLRFTSPFHVGRWSLMDSLDYVPSDTIYSALFSLSASTGLEMPKRVSSAYPVNPEGRDVEERLGMPVPATWKVEGFKRGIGGKYVKKARFMPLACLRSGSVEEGGDGFKCRLPGGSIRLDRWPCDGRTEAGQRPCKGLGSRVVISRNRISRHVVNADPYKIAAFIPSVPYVIYFEGGDRRLFELLGKVGIGGERAVGLGKFEVLEFGEVEFLEGGKAAMLLGVGRPVGFKNAVGEWAVRSWRCTHGIIGPLSVLLDGGVVEGDFEFEDVERADSPCLKKLSPLWIWLS